MSFYWHSRFLKHLPDITCVCEVGARWGDETLILSKVFPGAKILSFECNPLTVDTCRQKLQNKENITFYDCALGDKEGEEYFYQSENHGISSFLKRIDSTQTQQLSSNKIKIRRLCDVMEEDTIGHIDLLCMDVQGYELNVLRGIQDISKIAYVIMEEPKPEINRLYLPENTHSKYIDAPSSATIKQYMLSRGFEEIERIPENEIEDNVMYKNVLKISEYNEE